MEEKSRKKTSHIKFNRNKGISTQFYVVNSTTKLHNKELYAVYSSPNIIRVIKTRRLRWAGHVARMGREERCIHGFSGET
jgi:hypothetical protein